jgi:hypothetical protein
MTKKKKLYYYLYDPDDTRYTYGGIDEEWDDKLSLITPFDSYEDAEEEQVSWSECPNMTIESMTEAEYIALIL